MFFLQDDFIARSSRMWKNYHVVGSLWETEPFSEGFIASMTQIREK
jgi:hypothetical protein